MVNEVREMGEKVMTTKPPILWRWKGHGKFTEGVVQQEMKEMIKIDGEWFLKADIDIKGYEEKVTA